MTQIAGRGQAALAPSVDTTIHVTPVVDTSSHREFPGNTTVVAASTLLFCLNRASRLRRKINVRRMHHSLATSVVGARFIGLASISEPDVWNACSPRIA